MNGGSLYVKATGHAPQEIPFGCNGGSAELGDIALTADWDAHGPGGRYPGRTPERSGGGGTIRAAKAIHPRKTCCAFSPTAKGRFTLRGLPTTNELIFFYKDGLRLPQLVGQRRHAPGCRRGHAARMPPGRPGARRAGQPGGQCRPAKHGRRRSTRRSHLRCRRTFHTHRPQPR